MVEMDKRFFFLFVVFLSLGLFSFFYGWFTSFIVNYFVFVKPITAIQYCAFLSFVFLCLAFQDKFQSNMTKVKKRLYTGLGFFIAMASGFEAFWNFYYWFSQSTINSNIALDSIRNLIIQNNTQGLILNITSLFNTTLLQQNGLYPIDLNIATKLWWVLFFGALYWIYFMSTLKTKEDA